jgi:hypothetical protein
MKRDRPLRFEALESRQLLATAHTPALPSIPISIDGTLSVNVNHSTQMQDANGGFTTSVPISGQLGTLGKVTGTWTTSINSYGAYEGPDTLQLQTKGPKGSVVIAFNNLNLSKPTKVSPGLGFYQHGQHLVGASGVEARATENGSIELMVNAKKGSVTSLVLITVPPTTGPAH